MSTPGLPALLHPLVRAFLDTPGALTEALTRFGTPLHLLFPQVCLDNLARLRAVPGRHRLPLRICYAHKVNQSRAVLRTVRAAGAAVDVASAQELAAAREAGFAASQIEVTGPKGRLLLGALAGSGVTVNVDNAWELAELAALADPAAPVPVLLRLTGFAGPDSPGAVSRFGIGPDEVDELLTLLAAHRDRIVLRGFAFHLDTGELDARVRAVQACLGWIERAHTRGLAPSVIDIGGGFRQVFTADADRFEHYTRLLRQSLLGRGEPMSWGANTFGYQLDATGAHGTPIFHKYANTEPATAMLTALLGTPLPEHGGQPLARVLADNLLELWCEPGKAVLDHAGITVAGVEFVKRATDGSTVVSVDIGRDTITPADQEVMVDPLLLPGPDSAAGDDGDPAGVFIAGHLCLERDLITNHKVWLPWVPRPGDVLVFPNTGAYHMDLSAARASQHPLPPKIAVDYRDGFRLCPDEDYRPEPVPAGGS
ncbi:putative decarboxylase [Nocardia nova SH22a]|uniref:Putative decarboxylase n=1 Tax=Nocardia nova SH22a TaxID=1415166 RepID=W5TI79_9NOCA|nr:alanine racemase [Nocardia nova]AHH18849.1 putative decarboxylase [Nocardia nova SH22a]